MSQLLEQRREMQKARARLAADLRSEDRKKVRLLETAARLSDADLQKVIQQRAEAKAKAAAKAACKPKAKAKAKAKAKHSDGGAGA